MRHFSYNLAIASLCFLMIGYHTGEAQVLNSASLNSQFNLPAFSVSANASKNIVMTITNNTGSDLSGLSFRGDFVVTSTNCTAALVKGASCAANLTYNASSTQGQTTATETYGNSSISTSVKAHVQVFPDAYDLLTNTEMMGYYPVALYIDGINIYAAVLDIHEDYYLLYSNDGGNSFQKSSQVFTLHPSDFITALYVNGNTIYVGTTDGLYIGTGGGSSTFHLTNLGQSTYIDSLYAVGSTLYVATGQGLYSGAIGSGTFTGNANESEAISGIGSDSAGNIYITDGSNIKECTSQCSDSHATFTTIDTIPAPSLFPIGRNTLFINSNTIYVLQYVDGVYRCDINGNNTCNRINMPNAPYYFDSISGNNGVISIGTEKGIYISHDNGKTFTQYNHNNLPGLPANSIFQNSPVVLNNNSVYMGVDQSTGLFEYDLPTNNNSLKNQ